MCWCCAGPAAGRQCLALVDVPADDDHVVRLQRTDRAGHDVLDVARAIASARASAARASRLFVPRPVAVWQMAQLHRFHDAVNDHGRAQTGTEAEKRAAAGGRADTLEVAAPIPFLSLLIVNTPRKLREASRVVCEVRRVLLRGAG